MRQPARLTWARLAQHGSPRAVSGSRTPWTAGRWSGGAAPAVSSVGNNSKKWGTKRPAPRAPQADSDRHAARHTTTTLATSLAPRDMARPMLLAALACAALLAAATPAAAQNWVASRATFYDPGPNIST
jgi:hypothetical protein